ncbi:rhomboid family intramembrane serine protease [Oscillatoria sp. CS-180]|uniref:rhomboid family intramembrane serine protease n=1 Tax=Oscillatoria sp. CS-180 TaxID=3021720 RepID=UPI00232B3C15|nr:rhomboid family intramembrane serine protease [Oscillatoria sp. CS-180]MDB9528075.1 rhomboid family intramembrane serine protease [Oscillatoria sp. CS-180]
MVPLKDDNPIKITPYVTYGLIAINVLVFLYELTLLPPDLMDFFQSWAVVPEQLTGSLHWKSITLSTVHEWFTLISAQFIHAGFLHIAGNMLYLWVFGNNVEEELGHIRFLLFYLICGTLATMTQWYFGMSSEIPSLGASGAIAGVMGAYVFRFPDVRILTIVPLGFFFFPIRIPAMFYLGIWFLQQAAYGVASLNVPANIGMAEGGIAYWAHAGGFVFGAIAGPLLGLFESKREEFSMKA